MRFWRLHPGLILKRFLLATLIASVVSCWIFVYQVFNMDVPSRQSRKPPNFHVQKCQRPRKYFKSPLKLSYVDEIFAKSDNHTQNELEQTVLIVVRQPSSIFRTHVCDVLEANRIPYQNFFVGDKLPLSSVIDVNVGKFSTVIFESLDFYVSLESLSKKLLEQYCRKFSVGLVIFTQTETQVQDNFPHQVEGLDFKIQRGVKGLRNAELNENSRLLRVTRAGGVITGTLPGSEWCVFFSDALNKSFESVELATKVTVLTAFNEDKNNKDLKRTLVSKKYTTILHDLGKVDGIQRVYFGSGLQFWLHKLIFVDALALMSRGKLSRPLDRWILVDIDDIFVGKSGSRMTLLDVEALLDAQKKLQLKVPGFRFNMGFSGAFFLDGDDEEDEGDWALIKNAHSFWWFSHMWGHMKPHEIKALNDLVYDMKINWEFAKTHGIPISLSYAVAPHHSGVYPTHDALYEAWQRVYQLKVTSTEEYPHLKPARKRRGFIYKNIKVLPRQTCGLFTHTLLLDRYPKGRQVLEESVFGGSVFQVLAHNPVNIFMTHLSNYGNDRLGIYVFESVINHLHCWTNLNFQSAHPVQLAEKYFQLFPADVEPLWQNPCTDKRHLDIWAEGKTCNRLPSFLVIGPQKTGTTALYTFLNMHPEIISSEPSVKTFEEIQFFNGQNYARGLDWYMDFFPDLGNSSKIQSFEKSANYFDVEKTAARLHALIPTAKLIVILIDPAKRAYSWYQHMHSHLHHAAVSNSFYTVLTKTVGNSGDKQLTNLGQRCLNPGHYAYHLERWLNYFPPSQILILDGDKLKDDPISVMDEVQNFLKVTVIDYKTKLRFDRRKGFFCQLLTNGRTKCLGRGKGRRYRPMDAASKAFLQKYYMAPNKRLGDLLNKIKKPHPDWLRREISRYKKLAQ